MIFYLFIPDKEAFWEKSFVTQNWIYALLMILMYLLCNVWLVVTSDSSCIWVWTQSQKLRNFPYQSKFIFGTSLMKDEMNDCFMYLLFLKVHTYLTTVCILYCLFHTRSLKKVRPYLALASKASFLFWPDFPTFINIMFILRPL